MEPNFHHGETYVVNKLKYILQDPEYNDIVICKINDGVTEENIIKRVVGLPGDVIDFKFYDAGGYAVYKLVVNGKEMDEDYIAEDMTSMDASLEYPYTVDDGCYFVLGDNRNKSSDSRSADIGAVPKEDIVGVVSFKVWPLNWKI